ncbi:MAG TPA: ribose 5-phosphate isomerase A, partial [Candidatus Hodarchaeales archaeon]|nr:ribose 5-phosphate isomerase A [Candidatus Hodarchaeales archaeon]
MRVVDFVQEGKVQAALRAVELVRSGMFLGIGTGSTVEIFIDLLGKSVKEGKISDLTVVCSSVRSEKACLEAGLSIESADSIQALNLYVDGADEVTLKGISLKGMGGAHTREKLLRLIAKEFAIVVDASKVVSHLGAAVPICLEILPFCSASTL